MTNKAFGWLVTMAICLIVGIWGFCKTLHCNDFDKIQVIQSIDGEITINREGGWYAMVCPKIWTYPKACSYYFSNDTTQSKDHDAPSVQYANTGKGCLNCQVVYRIDWATDEQLKAMHEIAHGDDTILEQRVLSTLNNIAQMHASKMNSTDAIKRYDEFFEAIRKQIIHNKELKDTMAIDVVDFVIAGKPDFDKMTEQLFTAQQKADLEKQTADAEKIRLESEKQRAIALYEKEAAENEGKALSQAAKEIKDAERIKRLAEIEAEKLRGVAEIAKQTEAANLEKIKLIAQQTIEEAKAKKEAIALAGEITEVERVKLEIEKATKIGIAEAQSKTYAHWNPQVIQVTGNSGVSSATSSLDGFLNMKAAEAALEMTRKTK